MGEGLGTPYFMAPECEPNATDAITSRADLFSAGKILWTAITGRPVSREDHVFDSMSIDKLFPSKPELWHLHHIFEKTIRRKIGDRFANATEAILLGNLVYRLILGNYPPIQQIGTHCPQCGIGLVNVSPLNPFRLTKRPLPSNYRLMECKFCGYCFVLNIDTVSQNNLRLTGIS
jgi:hypothetical protein